MKELEARSFTWGNLLIHVVNGAWLVPGFSGKNLKEQSGLYFRVDQDGQAFASSPLRVDEKNSPQVIQVTRTGPLRRHSTANCPHSYTMAGVTIPGPILEHVASLSGLKLPDANSTIS